MSNRDPEDPSQHEPRNPNIDPGTNGDNDLEAGGGVKPGHTPPDSQSATSTPSHTPEAKPPRSKLALTLMIAIAVIFVFIFVAYAIGLWD
ncbi:hypothetical protein GCM10023190_21620 [Enteractinococcus fodinae]|uniref:Uncharacterized protein n=1 Tax=Enteractinococcus fodinae TaxID=684663 RepID=A0ABU2B517_9MICC|nr:DUF6480 family protein [Enteractinococcus fodinae]MDR7348079.1 hypothetical protein [Enteractinococcus fodinae]